MGIYAVGDVMVLVPARKPDWSSPGEPNASCHDLTSLIIYSYNVCIDLPDFILIFHLSYHFHLQLAKRRTKVVSFHRLSGTGMTSLIL